MEIKVMQGDLVEGLKFIKGFVNKNKEATALDKTILLEVISTAPAILRMRSNDKSIWGVIDIPLSYADEVGKFPLIDSEKFIGYLMTITQKDEIKMVLKNNNICITSKKEKSRPKIACMNGNYLLEPEMETEQCYTVNADNFKKGIIKSADLIPVSADKITDICVAVTINKNVIMFEARQLVTNLMMSYYLVNNMQTSEKGIRVIMECHKVKSVLTVFSSEDIDIKINENFIMFQQGNKRAFVKKVFGKITPFNHIFPKGADDVQYSFSCDKKDMFLKTTRIDKLMNSSLKVRYCDIFFNNGDGKLITDGGQSQVEEYVNFNGPESTEDIVKRFNINSLFKTLYLTDSDMISFLIPKENNHIFIFSQKDKGSMIKLIIPLLSI